MAPTTRGGPNTPINNTNPNNMTPESIQAMIDQALLRNATNGDGSHSSHGDNRRNVQTARPCFYADFMKCQPLNFKGAEGVVGLTRWIEKMESVFHISGCAVENQVKFATCTLLGAALTWWNGQIRTLGPEAYAMTWDVLKQKKTNKYCPQGEIKKLEIELWNLKVKGNDVPAYTERFQENTGNANVTNTQKGNGATPKGNGCFECGASGHFKRDCPKLKNKDGGNGNAQGWVYAVGNAERGDMTRKPDANVVTGTRPGLFSTNIRQEGGGQVGKETNRGRPDRPRFLEVFPEDLPVFLQLTGGISNRLVTGAAPVARSTFSDWPLPN
ncbi:putative reverse transcriptase domain-containing protein [Tanacetum coccineum]